jgi:hypothetical protein
MGMPRRAAVLMVNDAMMRFSGEVLGIDVNGDIRQTP